MTKGGKTMDAGGSSSIADRSTQSSASVEFSESGLHVHF